MKHEFKALHLQIQDLLAGYADDMLSEQDKRIVEAHLAGCEACRMDVSRQQILTQRLTDIPVTRMSSECHQRIDQTLNDITVPTGNAANKPTSQSTFLNLDWLPQLSASKIIANSGWGVALLLLIVTLMPYLDTINQKNIPMVRDIIAEYQQLNEKTLPITTQKITIAPPANWPNAHVLSHWKTTVGGASADAFAVRNGDNIVLQFRIDEAVFFHNPKVRKAVATTGNYHVKKHNFEVLAMPLKNAGLLMIGPAGEMPDPQTLMLISI